MRKLYIILTSIILIAFSGCENAFRDELHEIHNEIDELRVMIDKANSNIEALQTIVYALQEKDYVTGVTPIIENGVEVGYTIAFSKSGIATIYHGKDGYTPQIGVRKDTDSLYYWTLDGQWLLDEDGKKIRAVGVDGEDGEDGEDGIVPQLKIEGGYWFISYDNGESWNEIGKATGEDGKDGDPMFSSVDCTNSDYIVMTLSDGQTIIIPTWKAFEELLEECSKANANISAMQTIIAALQDNDFVQSITPIFEGTKEIGYIISFSKSGNVTIYHGQDGKDGQDGYTPVISARQDSDGIWYWTLDGEWMTDEIGQRIKAVGTDGQDGQPGKDAITPQLKIEDGYWFVSYDNGDSWHQIGKATGEDGKDGDPMFSSVDCTNSDYIVMTLSDGQTIIIPTWKAFEELQEECSKANANISAMQVIITALQDNDFVQSITPLYDGTKEVGYIISFSKSGNVTIYHGQDGKDGQDGYTPVISARQDSDGIWYWTLDGEWMTDENGQRIKAVGTDGQDGQPGKDAITPQLKIEDEYWFISYDNGESWEQLDKSTGKDGDSMFQEIRVADTEIIFVMADGSEFIVPRRPDVKIHFDIPEGETGILPGREIQIYYTLENATDETFVTASSNGHFTVRVESYATDYGRILIKCPHTYEDGYVNIMVSDGRSFSFVKVINLFEYYMEFSEGLEYYPGNHGGVIEIPFWTNFPYRFEVEYDAQEWLSIETMETRAEVEYGTLLVKVKENNEDHARTGRIYVYPTNTTGETYTEIIINQSSSTFRIIGQSKFAIPAEGKTVETEIVSSRGLSIDIPKEAETWLSATVEEIGTDQYKVVTTILENQGTEKRSASITLNSGNGLTYMGSLEYVQSSPNEEALEDMIFIVRANYSNDFIAHLPISGEFDCYIDWGDGQAEYARGGHRWENAGINHTYKLKEPASYTVKITGRVTGLNSENIPAPCVAEVVQWGMTGLNDLNSAFENNYLLKKVADDTYGSFSQVGCVDDMFKACTELEYIPEELFYNCQNFTCFYSTFENCKGLKEIPSRLFAKHRDLEVLYYTFKGCHSLTSIPADLFIFNSKIRSMEWVFHDCDNLTTIPAALFRNNPLIENFSGLFDNCDRLVSIPGSLFSTNGNAKEFSSTFGCCYALESIPAELFSRNKNARSFNSTFHTCRSLKEIPSSLFDNNRKVLYFRDTFSSCYELEGESPYTIINGVKYHLYERHLNPDNFVPPLEYYGCFGGCERLIDYYTGIEPNKWNWY